MGTNYYLIHDKCLHCGRSSDRMHIGKSSMGWCFALHVSPADGITNLAGWEQAWSAPNTDIVDEYGEPVDREEMLKIIRGDYQQPGRFKAGETWDNSFYATEEAFHRENHSQRGPLGLARHKLDGHHCVGHEETWDLIAGEFS